MTSVYLSVKVVEACNLSAAGQQCDPLVELGVGETTWLTCVQEKTTAPIWNEQFVFPVENPFSNTLRVAVWNGAKGRSELGKYRLQLDTWILNDVDGQVHDVWLPLQKFNEALQQWSSENAGAIRLQLIPHGFAGLHPLGPNPSNRRRRLRVTVAEARNIANYQDLRLQVHLRLDSTAHVTPVSAGGAPKWSSTFLFSVLDEHSSVLVLHCVNLIGAEGTQHSIIGSNALRLDHLPFGVMQSVWVPLYSRSSSPQGEVQLIITAIDFGIEPPPGERHDQLEHLRAELRQRFEADFHSMMSKMMRRTVLAPEGPVQIRLQVKQVETRPHSSEPGATSCTVVVTVVSGKNFPSDGQGCTVRVQLGETEKTTRPSAPTAWPRWNEGLEFTLVDLSAATFDVTVAINDGSPTGKVLGRHQLQYHAQQLHDVWLDMQDGHVLSHADMLLFEERERAEHRSEIERTRIELQRKFEMERAALAVDTNRAGITVQIDSETAASPTSEPEAPTAIESQPFFWLAPSKNPGLDRPETPVGHTAKKHSISKSNPNSVSTVDISTQTSESSATPVPHPPPPKAEPWERRLREAHAKLQELFAIESECDEFTGQLLMQRSLHPRTSLVQDENERRTIEQRALLERQQDLALLLQEISKYREAVNSAGALQRSQSEQSIVQQELLRAELQEIRQASALRREAEVHSLYEAEIRALKQRERQLEEENARLRALHEQTEANDWSDAPPPGDDEPWDARPQASTSTNGNGRFSPNPLQPTALFGGMEASASDRIDLDMFSPLSLSSPVFSQRDAMLQSWKREFGTRDGAREAAIREQQGAEKLRREDTDTEIVRLLQEQHREPLVERTRTEVHYPTAADTEYPPGPSGHHKDAILERWRRERYLRMELSGNNEDAIRRQQAAEKVLSASSNAALLAVPPAGLRSSEPSPRSITGRVSPALSDTTNNDWAPLLESQHSELSELDERYTRYREAQGLLGAAKSKLRLTADRYQTLE